jgi:hypothetical protein
MFFDGLAGGKSALFTSAFARKASQSIKQAGHKVMSEPPRRLMLFFLCALPFLSEAASAHYLEPSDTTRATVIKHSFGAKRHVAKDHKKQREIDAAHKAALSRITEPPAPKDPWAQVRP